MKNKCCQYCKEQFDGCHSVCVKFMAEELTRDSEKEKIRKAERLDRAFNDYRANVWNKKKVKK
jgi:hypothetical protein